MPGKQSGPRSVIGKSHLPQAQACEPIKSSTQSIFQFRNCHGILMSRFLRTSMLLFPMSSLLS